MSVFSYLRLHRFRLPPATQSLETEIVAGLLTKVNVFSLIVRSLDDGEAQRAVTLCGEYLRHAIEGQLGYDAMENLFRAAGLGPASHLTPEWSEGRIIVVDELDYGRQLTPKERLTDRSQRLNVIAKLIMAFGFNSIRNDQQKACAYLFEFRPSTNRNKARNDE